MTSASISNINGSTWTADYSYYADGNIDEKEINSSDTTTYSYDNDLMTAASGAESFSLSWDDNGNMTTGPLADLQYNWDSKLRLATDAADPCNTFSVRYDPDGNRLWKISTDSETTEGIRYIVDPVGDLPVVLMEIDPNAASFDPCNFDPNGSIIDRTYIYVHAQPIAMFDGDMDTGTKYFCLHDRLGSVRALVDSSGDVVNHYTYEPYGTDFTAETEETVDNAFKFTGQYHDEEIEQYYLRARQYDLIAIRFTGYDPARADFKTPLTLHRYLYCANGPVNRTDINGETFSYAGLAISTGFGALQGAAQASLAGDRGWNFVYRVFAGAASGAVCGGIGGTAWVSSGGLFAKFAVGFAQGAVAGSGGAATNHLLNWNSEGLWADMFAGAIIGGALGGIGGGADSLDFFTSEKLNMYMAMVGQDANLSYDAIKAMMEFGPDFLAWLDTYLGAPAGTDVEGL